MKLFSGISHLNDEQACWLRIGSTVAHIQVFRTNTMKCACVCVCAVHTWYDRPYSHLRACMGVNGDDHIGVVLCSMYSCGEIAFRQLSAAYSSYRVYMVEWLVWWIFGIDHICITFPWCGGRLWIRVCGIISDAFYWKNAIWIHQRNSFNENRTTRLSLRLLPKFLFVYCLFTLWREWERDKEIYECVLTAIPSLNDSFHFMDFRGLFSHTRQIWLNRLRICKWCTLTHIRKEFKLICFR